MTPEILGGIQYIGVPGITEPCKQAVMRLLQSRERIAKASILTNNSSHCLLLTTEDGDVIAVKSGFATGYPGEGSRGLSSVLCMLRSFRIPIEEFDVSSEVFDRVDQAALNQTDLARLESSRPVRPSRWFDYLLPEHYESRESANVLAQFDPVVPLGLIDPRIADLATSFWDGPDEKLLTGYRRLEDIVRKRSGIDDHGSKLFSQAFMEQSRRLSWPSADEAEQKGRAMLFVGAFMAYRNPRAHRELGSNERDYLCEFLMLNNLFLLEKAAISAGSIGKG